MGDGNLGFNMDTKNEFKTGGPMYCNILYRMPVAPGWQWESKAFLVRIPEPKKGDNPGG